MQGQASSEQDGGYGALDILDASQECAWILQLDGAIEHANRHAQAMFAAGADASAPWREIRPEESRFSLDRAFDIAWPARSPISAPSSATPSAGSIATPPSRRCATGPAR